jgi:hypothetical protein
MHDIRMSLFIQPGHLLGHFVYKDCTDVSEMMNPASIIERYVSAQWPHYRIGPA